MLVFNYLERRFMKSDRKPFFKSIIVGADFSRRSKKVFANALELAKQTGAKVVLVHIVEYFYYDKYTDVSPDWREKKNKLLKRIYQSYGPRMDVKVIVDFGDPATDIIKIAKKFQKPIILVGHSDKGAFSRVMLGSVSHKLASKSPVPVWIQ